MGHVENTTGTTLVRNQAASGLRPAYTLDGSGVGIAILDSGIYSGHAGFRDASGALACRRKRELHNDRECGRQLRTRNARRRSRGRQP